MLKFDCLRAVGVLSHAIWNHLDPNPGYILCTESHLYWGIAWSPSRSPSGPPVVPRTKTPPQKSGIC